MWLYYRMVHYSRITIASLLFCSLFVALPEAHAKPGFACSARIHNRNGTVLVTAKGFAGSITWGDSDETADNEFADLSCISGNRATNCTLGAEGTAERITPPPLCRIHLQETDTGETCSAFIPKCTPGVRAVEEPTESVPPSVRVWLQDDHDFQFSGRTIDYSAESWDTDDMHNASENSRLVARTAGMYHVYFHVALYVSPGRFNVCIEASNGRRACQEGHTESNPYHLSVSMTLPLDVGEYVVSKIRDYGFSGSSTYTDVRVYGDDLPSFGMDRIGPYVEEDACGAAPLKACPGDPLRGCCMCDGTCQDLPRDECLSGGGYPASAACFNTDPGEMNGRCRETYVYPSPVCCIGTTCQHWQPITCRDYGLGARTEYCGGCDACQ